MLAVLLPPNIRHGTKYIENLSWCDLYPNRTLIQAQAMQQDPTNPPTLNTDELAGAWLYKYMVDTQLPYEQLDVYHLDISRPMATLLAYKAAVLFGQPTDTAEVKILGTLLEAVERKYVKAIDNTTIVNLCPVAHAVLKQGLEPLDQAIHTAIHLAPIPTDTVRVIPVRDHDANRVLTSFRHRTVLTHEEHTKLQLIAARILGYSRQSGFHPMTIPIEYCISQSPLYAEWVELMSQEVHI